MSKLLYKGKDVERMNRDELIVCVRELFRKLKDKHYIIEGMKMGVAASGDYSMDRKMEIFNKELAKAMKGKK